MNEAQRSQLIEAHRPLVGKAVTLIWPRVQAHVDREELHSAGDLGLVEAAQRYDPESGVAFSTFAWYRVQGEILDMLRRARNLPRRVAQQLMALRAASEVLEAQGTRAASARSRGAGPKKTAERLAAMKDAMLQIQVTYALVSRKAFDADTREAEADPAEESLDRARFTRGLDRAIAALTDKERALVTKHYLEDKSLAEAGEELGLSRSWASRVHAQAIEKLRARLLPDSS